MRNTSRNLLQKKEEKWLEHQLAFSLSFPETTQSRFHSISYKLLMFPLKTSIVLEKVVCIKSDAERSNAHEFVDRTDTCF